VTSTGDGVRIEQGRFTGGIDIGDVHAGDPQGGTQVP
jgi:hypothetical protein